MNKEEFNHLIGKYINGYKIIRIENDPFIKGQINLWTDENIIEAFGDRNVIKFYIRNENNSSKIYKELVDKENYDLQQENQRLLELCMYSLMSSTKIYNHELANDTKQAFMKIIKENLNDDTYTLRNKIEKHWNGDKQ